MPKADVVTASAAAAPKPRIGKGWEAWLAGEWFPVEILKVKDLTVDVKWDWDGSVSEIWNHYVRPTPSAAPFPPDPAPKAVAKPQPAVPTKAPAPAQQQAAAPPQSAAPAPAAQPPAQRQAGTTASAPTQPASKAAPKAAPKAPGPLASFTVGTVIEGVYRDGSWYEATVVQAVDAQGNLRVKWGYDGSEGTLTADGIRAKGAAAPPPASPPSEVTPTTVAAAPAAAAAKAPPGAAPPPKSGIAAPASAGAVKAAPGAAPSLKAGGAPPSKPPPPIPPPQPDAAALAQQAEDVRRILELIPQDAPAEVRSYLRSLLPADVKLPLMSNAGPRGVTAARTPVPVASAGLRF